MAEKFRSKKEISYDILRDAIIKGEYEAGTRLVIDNLARKIGASQIPIREAIQQLEADGFVRIEPNVGAHISPIDATFIFEVFALLESLEIISSTAACPTISTEKINILTNMVFEMREIVNDTDKWSEYNKAFHLYICRCAGTELVMKTMEKAFAHWDRLRNHYLKDISDSRQIEAQAQHYDLLDALRSRDPNKVTQIVREHNQTALKHHVQHLKKRGLLTAER